MEAVAPKRTAMWKRAGTELSGDGDVSQILKEAQLDWSVDTAPVKVVQRDGTDRISNNVRAIVRTDTGEDLGIASTGYEPIPNSMMFNAVNQIAEIGEEPVRWDTAGIVNGGELVWAMAELPRRMFDIGGAQNTLYLLAVTSHNTQAALRIAITGVQIWCYNMVLHALGRAKSVWSIRHFGEVNVRLGELKSIVAGSLEWGNTYRESALWLADQEMSERQIAGYVSHLIPMPEGDIRDNTAEAVFRSRQKLVDLMLQTASAFPDIGYTRWAAFSAVVDYMSYFTRVRVSEDMSSSDVASRRFSRYAIQREDKPVANAFNVLTRKSLPSASAEKAGVII